MPSLHTMSYIYSSDLRTGRSWRKLDFIEARSRIIRMSLSLCDFHPNSDSQESEHPVGLP